MGGGARNPYMSSPRDMPPMPGMHGQYPDQYHQPTPAWEDPANYAWGSDLPGAQGNRFGPGPYVGSRPGGPGSPGMWGPGQQGLGGGYPGMGSPPPGASRYDMMGGVGGSSYSDGMGGYGYGPGGSSGAGMGGYGSRPGGMGMSLDSSSFMASSPMSMGMGGSGYPGGFNTAQAYFMWTHDNRQKVLEQYFAKDHARKVSHVVWALSKGWGVPVR